jgi:hypothetical protein
MNSRSTTLPLRDDKRMFAVEIPSALTTGSSKSGALPPGPRRLDWAGVSSTYPKMTTTITIVEISTVSPRRRGLFFSTLAFF